MRLAVFDIDGTLTDTFGVDAECFAASVESVFGVSRRVIEGEWREYPHITDAGIAGTVVERHLGRAIEPDELVQLELEFVERLGDEFERAPERCRALPGAIDFLAEMTEAPGWSLAMATGGFRSSALLKLVRAGFRPPPILSASGPEVARAAIVKTAIRQAVAEAGESAEVADPVVVLLGDGPWDVRTASELGLPCVGIGSGEAAVELLELGAVGVVPDYRNGARVWEIIDAALAVAG